jgi:hypothetical protein
MRTSCHYKGVSESAGSQLRVAQTEARKSLGTLRNGSIHHWKPLPSSAMKIMSENTSLCMIVIYKV